MKYHFCTCFDNNYLVYGYTLYSSLKAAVRDFTLYVVCLDDSVYENLKILALQEVELIRLSQVEEADPEYAATAANRSRTEYIFTLSPVMPLYILKKYPHIDILAYADSDLFFFSSPERLYRELGEKSVLLFEHDYYPENADLAEKYGRFNMGFQLYRNDPTGLACLRHWRRECLEWCYDRPQDGKYADQKYLEEWPGLFDAVIASNSSGGGLAPWNCAGHTFDFRRKIPLLDGKNEVIFYHYQGCKLMKHNVLLLAPPSFQHHIPTKLTDYFYSGYFRALQRSRAFLMDKLTPERLQCVYFFNREKSSGSALKYETDSRVKHFLASIKFHIPLFLNGRLTYKGKRVFPLIFRLFHYRKISEKQNQFPVLHPRKC